MEPKLIIAICGRRYHGKNTCADYINTHLPTAKQLALAQYLKSAACGFMNIDPITYEQVKDTPDPYFGYSLRDFMIKLGDHFEKFDQLIHVKRLTLDLERVNLITDLRQPHECDHLRGLVGYRCIVIKVVREGIVASDHYTESRVDLIEPDFTVSNISLPELYSNIDKILLELGLITQDS